MTPAELDALESLLAKATPGPWVDDGNARVQVLDKPDAPRGYPCHSDVADCDTMASAAAIVALHNAAAELIAAARTLAEMPRDGDRGALVSDDEIVMAATIAWCRGCAR